MSVLMQKLTKQQRAEFVARGANLSAGKPNYLLATLRVVSRSAIPVCLCLRTGNEGYYTAAAVFIVFMFLLEVERQRFDQVLEAGELLADLINASNNDGEEAER